MSEHHGRNFCDFKRLFDDNMSRQLHDSGLMLALPRTITPIGDAAQKTSPPRALMMHVRLGHPDHPGGVRHRIMLDKEITSRGAYSKTWIDPGSFNGRTACDVTIADKYYSPVDAGYDGDLCQDGCFSVAELRVARQLRLEDEQRHAADVLRREEERIASNARALAEREEAQERLRRFKSVETAPVSKIEPDEDG